MNFKDIETERFILKILIPELVSETYVLWFSDKESSSYIQYASQSVNLEKLKTYVEEKYQSPAALMFGIFSKENSKHLGNIKFEPIDFQKKIAVLGILIGDQSWRGKGLFGEISVALEYELKSIGIDSICLGVEKDNVSAIRAYEKSGYIIDSSNYLTVDLTKSLCMIKGIK